MHAHEYIELHNLVPVLLVGKLKKGIAKNQKPVVTNFPSLEQSRRKGLSFIGKAKPQVTSSKNREGSRRDLYLLTLINARNDNDKLNLYHKLILKSHESQRLQWKYYGSKSII